MSPSEVVVGVDGSSGSIAALKWATAEASRRDSELVVVHAYDWRIVGARVQIGGANADDARVHAREISEAALAEARSLAPAVKVRGEIVQKGHPDPCSSMPRGTAASWSLVVAGEVDSPACCSAR